MRRLTYANVASTLALVLAMSGTSYAIIVTSSSVKNNSLTGVDIKDGSISTAELATASVGSAEVIDKSLKLRDLNAEVKNAMGPKGFVQRLTGTVTIPPAPGASDNVAFMGLPAGRYYAVASLQIDGGLADPNSQIYPNYTVSCTMRDPGGMSVTRSLDLRSDYHELHPMTLILAHDNTGEGLMIDCSRTAPVAFANEARVIQAELDVIPLSALTPR